MTRQSFCARGLVLVAVLWCEGAEVVMRAMQAQGWLAVWAAHGDPPVLRGGNKPVTWFV
jgi:hypothetical protein